MSECSFLPACEFARTCGVLASCKPPRSIPTESSHCLRPDYSPIPAHIDTENTSLLSMIFYPYDLVTHSSDRLRGASEQSARRSASSSIRSYRGLRPKRLIQMGARNATSLNGLSATNFSSPFVEATCIPIFGFTLAKWAHLQSSSLAFVGDRCA